MSCKCSREDLKSYLFLLLIEVVDDDTDEEVQCEEGTEDDEDDKVDVHVYVVLVHWLVFHLCSEKVIIDCNIVLVWCSKMAKNQPFENQLLRT